jgi:hypothetical protein
MKGSDIVGRNYFDSNDSRNFSSLAKEARQYSKDDANALREHYKLQGVASIVIPMLIGRGVGFVIDKLSRIETKIERVRK